MTGKKVQGFLDFTLPTQVPISNIDTRGWRRVSVATGRCVGKCGECTCVSDLQMLARDSAMEVISFGSSGNPVLSLEQLQILRAKKETSVPNESTDSVDIRVEIPPAQLTPCSDEEL